MVIVSFFLPVTITTWPLTVPAIVPTVVSRIGALLSAGDAALSVARGDIARGDNAPLSLSAFFFFVNNLPNLFLVR